MNNVTGVMLNWKRPTNVARILSGWQASGIVTEAIVWNNNPAATFRHQWASNECLLIQDDDLELPAESLRALVDAWQDDPDIIHGVFGRAPKPDGSYARNIGGDAESPVVLTRVLLAHRRYASRFFQVAPTFDDVQREGKPAGNGEDIIFSYVATSESGRLNRVHRVSVTELPAPHSIRGRNWKGHVAHRTRLLRACEAWLKENQHEDRRDLLHV